MNKILLFIFLLNGIAFSGLGQTKPGSQLSIGGEFGFPAGKAASVYGSAVGGSVKLELPVSQAPFYFTLTGGITDYLVKLTFTGTANPAAYIPVEAGGKFYFSKISYVEGDFGYSASISSGYTGPKNAFIFAPIIGFSAPMYKKKSKIDIGLRYEGRVERTGIIGQVAARLAYRFGL